MLVFAVHSYHVIVYLDNCSILSFNAGTVSRTDSTETKQPVFKILFPYVYTLLFDSISLINELMVDSRI